MLDYYESKYDGKTYGCIGYICADGGIVDGFAGDDDGKNNNMIIVAKLFKTIMIIILFNLITKNVKRIKDNNLNDYILAMDSYAYIFVIHIICIWLLHMCPGTVCSMLSGRIAYCTYSPHRPGRTLEKIRGCQCSTRQVWISNGRRQTVLSVWHCSRMGASKSSRLFLCDRFQKNVHTSSSPSCLSDHRALTYADCLTQYGYLNTIWLL